MAELKFNALKGRNGARSGKRMCELTDRLFPGQKTDWQHNRLSLTLFIARATEFLRAHSWPQSPRITVESLLAPSDQSSQPPRIAVDSVLGSSEQSSQTSRITVESLLGPSDQS